MIKEDTKINEIRGNKLKNIKKKREDINAVI